MKILRSFRYFLIPSLSCLILVTCIASFMSSVNDSYKPNLDNQLFESSQINSALNPNNNKPQDFLNSNGPIQVQDIQFSKAIKNNWTWPNNTYQNNQGYTFTSITNKDTKNI